MRSAMERMGASWSRSERMFFRIDLPLPRGCGRRVSLKRRRIDLVVGLEEDQARL